MCCFCAKTLPILSHWSSYIHIYRLCYSLGNRPLTTNLSASPSIISDKMTLCCVGVLVYVYNVWNYTSGWNICNLALFNLTHTSILWTMPYSNTSYYCNTISGSLNSWDYYYSIKSPPLIITMTPNMVTWEKGPIQIFIFCNHTSLFQSLNNHHAIKTMEYMYSTTYF